MELIAESEEQGERRKERRAWSEKLKDEHRTSNIERRMMNGNRKEATRSKEKGAKSVERRARNEERELIADSSWHVAESFKQRA